MCSQVLSEYASFFLYYKDLTVKWYVPNGYDLVQLIILTASPSSFLIKTGICLFFTVSA